MTQGFSQMARARRSLESVRNSKKLLPKFYLRGTDRKDKKGNLAWCMAGIPPELLRAFDVDWEWPENFGTLCAANLVAPKFIEIAEAEGYSGDLCSYATNTIGYCKRCQEVGGPPPESPLDMGQPSMLIGSGLACDPRFKWLEIIATRFFDVPMFNMDPLSPSYDIDVNDPRVAEHYTTHLREELKALVEFLKKETGRELDMNRFREIMDNSHKAHDLWFKTLEMRKNRPCPMGAEDYFSCIIPQMFMLGEEETVGFFQAIHDEVKQRVEQGKGVIENEKYRLFWTGLPPWFNLGLFNYLESLGAIVVAEASYYCAPPVEVDNSDPLEALVQRAWKTACWHQQNGNEIMPEVCNPAIFGFVGTQKLVDWIDEYHLTGALMNRTSSCRATCIGQVHHKNVFREKGIPSLIIESDMADPRRWSDAKIKAQIEAFLENIDKL